MRFHLGKSQVEILGSLVVDDALPGLIQLHISRSYISIEAVHIMHDNILSTDLPKDCPIQVTVQGNPIKQGLADDNSQNLDILESKLLV